MPNVPWNNQEKKDFSQGKWLLHTIVFHKKNFDRIKLKKWIKEHGYKMTYIDEEANTYRVRQLNPGDYKITVFETKVIPGNINLVFMKHK